MRMIQALLISVAIACAASLHTKGLIKSNRNPSVFRTYHFLREVYDAFVESEQSGYQQKHTTTTPYPSLGKNLDNSPTLVLNADYKPLSYMPLSLWSWQDSVSAVMCGKASVINSYENLAIRGVSFSISIPSVIALNKYQATPNKVPNCSRRNIFIRDSFCCQYCLEQYPVHKLSVDHVVPRSRGGKVSWSNAVTACLECNYRKGGIMPEELPKIGMRLRSLPRAPSSYELQHKAKEYRRSQIHPHWEDYVF